MRPNVARTIGKWRRGAIARDRVWPLGESAGAWNSEHRKHLGGFTRDRVWPLRESAGAWNSEHRKRRAGFTRDRVQTNS